MNRSILAPFLVATALFSACDDSPTDPVTAVPIPTMLDSLFAPATSVETTAIAAQWASRKIQVTEAAFADSGLVAVQVPPLDPAVAALFGIPSGWLVPDTALVRLISHRVDGFRQYGAMLTGSATSRLPIVVFAHGGDDGLDSLQWRTIVQALKPVRDSIALIAPAFRGEPIGFLSRPVSEGVASPWDRDIEDLRSLVRVAASLDSRLDTTRVCLIGYSRGGGVALLAAERDPIFRTVATIAAPTAFQGPWARSLAESILAGTPVDLPGLDFLATNVLIPLQQGRISMDSARKEFIRRSATTWAARLPEAMQLHHGYSDITVSPDELVRLQSALQSLGRSPMTHYWPNLNHTSAVPWALQEIVPFVRSRLLD